MTAMASRAAGADGAEGDTAAAGLLTKAEQPGKASSSTEQPVKDDGNYLMKRGGDNLNAWVVVSSAQDYRTVAEMAVIVPRRDHLGHERRDSTGK